MKKVLSLITVLIFSALILFGCGKETTKTEKTANQSAAVETAEMTAAEEKEDHSSSSEVITAEINIRDFGTIKFEMDAGKAPITVANFVSLAEAGFYNGLTFHRIIDGFMMQGGDPKGNGTGGSDQKIKGEFQANGVDNTQSHVRGAVSMARAADMNSASSQFFIVHKDSTFLDGQYACFGYVTEGMELVDKICENTPVTDNNGTVRAENQPVIESIRIIR